MRRFDSQGLLVAEMKWNGKVWVNRASTLPDSLMRKPLSGFVAGGLSGSTSPVKASLMHSGLVDAVSSSDTLNGSTISVVDSSWAYPTATYMTATKDASDPAALATGDFYWADSASVGNIYTATSMDAYTGDGDGFLEISVAGTDMANGLTELASEMATYGGALRAHGSSPGADPGKTTPIDTAVMVHPFVADLTACGLAYNTMHNGAIKLIGFSIAAGILALAGDEPMAIWAAQKAVTSGATAIAAAAYYGHYCQGN
jgi:hypothetical protein